MEDIENPSSCPLQLVTASFLIAQRGAGNEGEMTPLQAEANRYIAGRLRRREISAESSKMPRHALRTLCTSFGARPINQLGEAAILRWLETNVHKSPATRRNELGSVKLFCQFLVREGKLRRDPTVGIARIRQPRKVVHTLNRPAVEALWEVCENPRDRAIVSLMFILGLRCVDTSRLNWEDWDRYNNILIVCGKGHHERTLPVVPHVEAALKTWHASDPRSTGPMFPSPTGRLKPGTISQRVTELMWSSGIKAHAYDGKSAHALRRTAATETLEASHDIKAVQGMLGHANMSSLEFYIKRSGVDVIAAAVQSRFQADVA